MASLHVKYLLLGGGSAASGAAEAIREIDPVGEVTLVSAETSRPYHRPPLARAYLRKQLRQDELFAHPADWYARNRVTLRTQLRAFSLDTPKRSVMLSDGVEMFFDQLLLATGALPRHLGVPGDSQ